MIRNRRKQGQESEPNLWSGAIIAMSSIRQQSSTVECGRKILTSKDWQQIRQSLRLSEREFEIVQHIFDDNKTQCIAWELSISVHTVNTYLQRLYSKLDVRSRSQLVLRVLKTHLDYRANNCKCDRTDSNLKAAVLAGNDTRIQDLYID